MMQTFPVSAPDTFQNQLTCYEWQWLWNGLSSLAVKTVVLDVMYWLIMNRLLPQVLRFSDNCHLCGLLSWSWFWHITISFRERPASGIAGRKRVKWSAAGEVESLWDDLDMRRGSPKYAPSWPIKWWKMRHEDIQNIRPSEIMGNLKSKHSRNVTAVPSFPFWEAANALSNYLQAVPWADARSIPKTGDKNQLVQKNRLSNQVSKPFTSNEVNFTSDLWGYVVRLSFKVLRIIRISLFLI